MLVTYCRNVNCASPNYYSLEMPKFCGQCGSPLGYTVAAPKTAPIPKPTPKTVPVPTPSRDRRIKRQKPIQPAEFDYEPDEIVGRTVEIEKLDYDIVGGSKNSIKFKDLVEDGVNGPRQIEAGPKLNLSQAEVMAQIRAEARGSKTPIEIEDQNDV